MAAAINQVSPQRDGNIHEGFGDPAGAVGRGEERVSGLGGEGGWEGDSGGGDWFK